MEGKVGQTEEKVRKNGVEICDRNKYESGDKE